MHSDTLAFDRPRLRPAASTGTAIVDAAQDPAMVLAQGGIHTGLTGGSPVGGASASRDVARECVMAADALSPRISQRAE